MSIVSRNWIVIASLIVLGTGLAASAAHAFNPQPDPPAKLNKQFDPASKNTVPPGPCRGTKCQHLDIGSPGLLGDGSSSGFSTNGGPSAIGNLPAVQRSGGRGSRGAGGAGIR